MKVLLDTNMLLRIADQSSPQHAEAVAALNALETQGHDGCLVPQVLYEYWVVATRPLENNGLGMTTTNADAVIDRWIDLLTLLQDERGIFPRWRQLVATNDVKGKTAHDARLVAAMQRHGLTHLLTFNAADFSRYGSIVVWTPDNVIAQVSPDE